jgi:hypothetical protein
VSIVSCVGGCVKGVGGDSAPWESPPSQPP